MILKLCPFFLFLLMPFVGIAQQNPQNPPSVNDICTDPYLHDEMVQYNDIFIKQGFSIQLFKVIPFPKNSYVPVKIHMKQNKLYQVNFVANRRFQKTTITLVGKDKKEIFKETFRGKTSQQHWFSKSVSAPYTGDYWVIMSQKAKGQDIVCGGLSVMKAGASD